MFENSYYQSEKWEQIWEHYSKFIKKRELNFEGTSCARTWRIYEFNVPEIPRGSYVTTPHFSDSRFPWQCLGLPRLRYFCFPSVSAEIRSVTEMFLCQWRGWQNQRRINLARWNRSKKAATERDREQRTSLGPRGNWKDASGAIARRVAQVTRGENGRVGGDI